MSVTERARRCELPACVIRACDDNDGGHPAFESLRRSPSALRYSIRLDSEPSLSRCYVIGGCDSGGSDGNCGVCRFERRLGQRCGETGGVGLGVFGAEPAVSRQLLLENALDLPTAERLALLLLQATAAERSTLDATL